MTLTGIIVNMKVQNQKITSQIIIYIIKDHKGSQWQLQTSDFFIINLEVSEPMEETRQIMKGKCSPHIEPLFGYANTL